MDIEGAFFNTSDFKLQERKLGEGTYGDVYVARNISNNKLYAAKIIKTNNNFNGHQQMLLMRESLILHKLKHPGIIEFKGVNFQSFRDSTKLEPSIITEYLPRGSLKELLNQERKGLSNPNWTPTTKYIMLLGISNAMKYLHNHKIIHRDLKPENILVDNNFHPKICDFGLSRYFKKESNLTMTGEIGTPLYMSPELFEGDNNYNESIDVYAFSMLAYEIVSGKVPFSELGDSISTIKLGMKVTNGYRPKFPIYVTDKMKNLISKCWSGNSKERPTFDEIFNELSNDFSYLGEEVEEEEIINYIEKIKEFNIINDVESDEIEKRNDDGMLFDNLKKIKEKLFNDENFIQAIHHLHGRQKEINQKEAINKLKLSSQNGNGYSSYLLGLLYENNEEDFNKAFFYFKLSFQQGNSAGLNEIGFCYQNGIGVKQDYSKAAEFFMKSAELGNSAALNSLGFLYYNGNGVPKNYSKAAEFYQKSVDLGNSDALIRLAYLYQNGFGIEKNYFKSFELYKKSADLGNSISLINLGLFYCNGFGVEKNYLKAAECYKKSAQLGNSYALINLGLLYQNGYGFKQDYSKAADCFRKSFEMGNSNAVNNLNYLYENGYVTHS